MAVYFMRGSLIVVAHGLIRTHLLVESTLVLEGLLATYPTALDHLFVFTSNDSMLCGYCLT